MNFVTISQIIQQEQKIKEKLAGRDPQDINLPEELKDDIKWYQGLIMQYNAHALTTACVQPYKDKYSTEKISYREFYNKFENERYKTLSYLYYMNPTKIDELLSEISRNPLSIFKKPVNSSIEKLLIHLKEEHARNLIVGEVLDNIDASGLSI